MAHLGDNTKQRSVYFCLSLVLARVVKRVEATSTSTYCVWHFSCCRSYMVFYSLATSTPSWRSVFLCIFCQFLAGRTWYATFISLWLGTRSVLTGHLFPYRCLYLFLSLSFCLCFFLLFLISLRPCINTVCLHLQSCSFLISAIEDNPVQYIFLFHFFSNF